ncbi:unnamed protein product, partial [marine sediment metagenome]
TFRKLTQRDARRAFESGAITPTVFKTSLSQIGYTEENAEALIRWANINKARVLTHLPELRLFRDGMIQEGEARAILRRTKLEPIEIDSIIRILTLQRDKKFSARCISAVRKRFLTGELDEDEAAAALTRTGLSVGAVTTILESFECERIAEGKQPPTSMLCTWLEEGTINTQDFVDRLKRIGWSEEDAMRILVSCKSKISEKQARQAKRIANEEKRALEKQKREEEAERRKLARAIENAGRQREKAERLKRNRDKLIQRAVAR